jgi:hypothetical protein
MHFIIFDFALILFVSSNPVFSIEIDNFILMISLVLILHIHLFLSHIIIAISVFLSIFLTSFFIFNDAIENLRNLNFDFRSNVLNMNFQ